MHPKSKANATGLVLAALAICNVWAGSSLGQQIGGKQKSIAKSTSRDVGARRASQAAKGPYRKIAPGVEKQIPSDRKSLETTSRHDLIEILAADPQYGERSFSEGRPTAKDVVFRHDVWALDFAFKPLRFIDVDVPDPTGRFVKTQVWYLVYRVTNTGQVMRRKTSGGGQATVEMAANEKPVRFIPQFVLESWDTGKFYDDRLVPAAIPAIQRREDPNRTFLSTTEICGEVPVSTSEEDRSVWGVATWTDIDPATDHFSIYVQGLTNAYQWTDAKAGEEGAYGQGDPLLTGRQLLQKTLRLNFWRPSDRLDAHEDEVRFGFWSHEGDDRFGLAPEERVDYLWDYR